MRIDSVGKVLEHWGITDVINHPELGMPFFIDYNKAVEIAIENNLQDGLG